MTTTVTGDWCTVSGHGGPGLKLDKVVTKDLFLEEKWENTKGSWVI